MKRLGIVFAAAAVLAFASAPAWAASKDARKKEIQKILEVQLRIPYHEVSIVEDESATA